MYHTRVFMFDFQDDKLPKFKTDKEHQEFLAMIGRMVMYGCHDPKICDTIQFANGFMDHREDEMVISYHTIEAQPETWENGSRKYLESPQQKLDDFKRSMIEQKKPSITIGAVKRDEGNWSFHS